MLFSSVLFSSVTQSCPTLWDPMDLSTLGLPVHHHLPGFTQTHVHWVGDAIQPSHPPSSPFPLAFNLSQHQGLFKWVSSSHQVEFQLQHQSFQWIFRTVKYMANKWGKNGNNDRLYFLGLQKYCGRRLQPRNSKTLDPWKKSYDKPKQCVQKQRYHFSDKGLYSQSYGFSSSHVWMWELDHKEDWALKN